ncbi:hypothetical protein NEOLEDRAFT_1074704 [Neolentinus lepideus HHB14362 ss-1]|uniref:Uncharacterized protein n=1 Tax=Neolentinus lepideus HHB14362 ss-1 TaxID=1314782 RepID=A0A165PCK0_9AGAM|nr:hypothetical protein NEOLEDRAFT_1074704 [Neolentinus lepideus HHB14362 ss-1]
MPRVICTGYEITNALQKYLEVGHGVDFDKVLSVFLEDDCDLDEDDSDSDVDEKALAIQREAAVVMTYRDYFRNIRRSAPAEVRKALEIPYTFDKWDGHGLRVYMFIPTGAYTREYYKSGALRSPPEEDLKVIQTFIDAANSLLPDTATREKAEFKLEEMRFEVHSPRSLHAPPYYSAERKELSPPRHLRAFLNTTH